MQGPVLRSGVSSLYVRPLYPRKGEQISLCVSADSTRIKWVRMTVIENDNLFRYKMEKTSDDGPYDVYTARISSSDAEIRYWFEAELKDGSDCYLCARGVFDYLCSWKDAFVLRQDLDVPSWVPSSVCYQIFPDRFCNGDPGVGAKEGEYEFDGCRVRQMAWNEKPLPYNQGHCLDFFNGDLAGIASKADYLKSLGVTAIYLNPIGCSRTTHRYDCTDYFHVDPKLGGDDGYARMLKALHEAGIRVITDISINHTGTDHPWFISASEGGPEEEFYYRNSRGGFDCWFDVSTLPQLNYNSARLRDLIYRNEDSVLQKFLRAPFSQDGWRFDVATSVGNHEKERMCHEIWREVREQLKAIRPDVYLVGEDWDDSSEYLKGDQWDATMNYVGCSRPLRRWMGERDRFFWVSDNRPGKVTPYSAKQLKDHLENQLNSLEGQMVFQQMNLIDSHDIPRLHCHREVFDRNLYKGAVMMQFLLPGMPCIYYGDEIGIEGPMGSVENCRYPMVWDKERWDSDMYDFYVSLGKLRHEFPEALSEGQWEFGFCDDEVLEFRRQGNTQEVILVMYRGDSERSVPEIDVDGMRDWFSGEKIKKLTLKNRVSRILVN